MKHYAYWEKSHTGWNLVVYHNEKPGKPVGGSAPERIGPYEVPRQFISPDGTPIIGLIKTSFPLNQGEGE